MKSKAVAWKIWIMAVLTAASAICYGMYRMYENAYEMEGQTARQDGVSEEFVMETFSDTFFDTVEESEPSFERKAQSGEYNQEGNSQKEKYQEENFQEENSQAEISQEKNNAQKNGEDEIQKTESVSEEECFWVYVCGEVVNPGVYGLKQGSRIVDVIEAAGGFTEKAAKEYWNLAEKIEDGMKITVLSQEEAATDPYGTRKEETERDREEKTGRVNLNHASMEQLQELPGIGAAKAEDIIEYRKANGGFTAIEDVMNVPGIKESVFENIKDKIEV